jgi:hypothetical protein
MEEANTRSREESTVAGSGIFKILRTPEVYNN